MVRHHRAITIVSVLLGVFFLFAGGTKLAGMEPHVEQFAKWGYPDWFRLVVGTIEVVSGLLLLVPALSFYGAIGIVVVMLGAIYTHLTANEAAMLPLPLVLLVVAATVAYFARPRVVVA